MEIYAKQANCRKTIRISGENPQKEKCGWNFLFLGANIDAAADWKETVDADYQEREK